MFVRDLDGLPVATCQRLRFALIATTKDRSYRVNHMLRAKLSARSDHRLPRRKPSNLAHNLAALFKNCGTSGAVDRAIHSTSAQKR